MTALIHDHGVVHGFVNWGRWVARCGLCPAPAPATLQFGDRSFTCVECGTITSIIWPSEEMRAGIVRLLKMRPTAINRNWLPGETLIELVKENAAHGLYDNLAERGVEANPGDTLLVIDADRIRTDNLPALAPATPHREIGAA